MATCIKWIVEPQPTNENDLVDLYSDTWAKDYHGEWRLTSYVNPAVLNPIVAGDPCQHPLRRSLHPGEEPHCTATLLHFFDSKKCSEAGSQPKVRQPPMKESWFHMVQLIKFNSNPPFVLSKRLQTFAGYRKMLFDQNQGNNIHELMRPP